MHSQRVAQQEEKGRGLTVDEPVAIRRRIELAKILLSFEQTIQEALLELGRTKHDLFALEPDKACSLLDYCPMLDVETELFLQRNAQRDRAIDPNDLRDFAHLELAIPYCDAVITEKFWCNLAARCALPDKYDCLVAHDVRDLESLLRR